MHNHEPPNYGCPLCLIVEGKDDTDGWTTQAEVVYRSDKVVAWINPRWWPKNHGAVVMCPTKHFENIYDLPAERGADLQAVARIIALAMKQCYGCDGISTRQHNEPAGNQEVWHYHLHVFPRYEGDRLYERHSEARRYPIGIRVEFAERLRPFVEKIASEKHEIGSDHEARRDRPMLGSRFLQPLSLLGIRHQDPQQETDGR